VALLAEEGLAMANWSNDIDFLKKKKLIQKYTTPKCFTGTI